MSKSNPLFLMEFWSKTLDTAEGFCGLQGKLVVIGGPV